MIDVLEALGLTLGPVLALVVPPVYARTKGWGNTPAERKQ